MRILLVCASDPGDYGFGASQRDNNLRDSLRSIAEVDTIIWRFQDQPTNAIGWSDERTQTVMVSPEASRRERLKAFWQVRRLVREAEREHQYDAVVVRHFPRTLAVPLHAHAKMIVDADDFSVQAASGSLLKRGWQRARAALFRRIGARARHVWLVDRRDARSLALADGRISFLPNTARIPKALGRRGSQRGRRITMVGFFAYEPNIEGLVWFADQVLPSILAEFPDIEVHAIGKFAPSEARLAALPSSVIMRGYVDDLDAEYAESDVVICPIISGTGTQIKVIEALMHARPAVVTQFTYEGFAETLVPDRDLLVARDAASFGEKVRAVLRDPDAYSAMAANGRAAVEAVYSIKGFHEQVVHTLTSRQT